MPPGQDRQLEVVAQADAVARRRRNDLDLVVDVLELLAGLDPLGDERRDLGRYEYARRRKARQPPPRGVVREPRHVVEVPVRDADGRIPEDVLGRPAELEQASGSPAACRRTRAPRSRRPRSGFRQPRSRRARGPRDSRLPWPADYFSAHGAAAGVSRPGSGAVEVFGPRGIFLLETRKARNIDSGQRQVSPGRSFISTQCSRQRIWRNRKEGTMLTFVPKPRVLVAVVLFAVGGLVGCAPPKELVTANNAVEAAQKRRQRQGMPEGVLRGGEPEERGVPHLQALRHGQGDRAREPGDRPGQRAVPGQAGAARPLRPPLRSRLRPRPPLRSRPARPRCRRASARR